MREKPGREVSFSRKLSGRDICPRRQPRGGRDGRKINGKAPVAVLVAPLLSLVWARGRRGPKHPTLPRMRRAAKPGARSILSLARNREPGHPRALALRCEVYRTPFRVDLDVYYSLGVIARNHGHHPFANQGSLAVACGGAPRVAVGGGHRSRLSGIAAPTYGRACYPPHWSRSSANGHCHRDLGNLRDANSLRPPVADA
jgi:hypothetical protein